MCFILSLGKKSLIWEQIFLKLIELKLILFSAINSTNCSIILFSFENSELFKFLNFFKVVIRLTKGKFMSDLSFFLQLSLLDKCFWKFFSTFDLNFFLMFLSFLLYLLTIFERIFSFESFSSSFNLFPFFVIYES